MTSWRAMRFWCALVSGLVLAAPAVAAGPTVRGIVLDSNGKAFPKAMIELAPIEGELAWGQRILAGKLSRPTAAHTTSLPDGSFTLDAPNSGFYSLIVRAEGFVTMELQLAPLIDEVSVDELRLLYDAGLSARVTDPASAPVQGALVRASSASPWLWPRRVEMGWVPAERVAVAGEDGVVRLPRLAGEHLDLFGRGTSASGELAGEQRAAGARSGPVQLVLQPTLSRRVSVRGAQGEALARALVIDTHSQLPLAATRADGNVTVALALPGQAVLRFLALDHASFELTMHPSAMAPKGNAAPGAPEIVRLESRTRIAGRVLEKGTRAPLGGALVWAADRPEDSAPTDGQGRYVLSFDDRTSLRAAAAGHAGAWGFSARTGEQGWTFLLLPTRSLEGRVVDEARRPIAGADITLSPSTTRSDSVGRFRLHGFVTEGPYSINARHSGYAPTLLTVQPVANKAALAPIVLTLTRGETALLHIANFRGEPLVRATATLLPTDPGFRRRPRAASDKTPATSDARGRAVWEHLSPGTYDIAIEAKGFAPLRLPGVVVAHPKPPATAVDFGGVRLSPGAVLDGVVVSLAGEPLAKVELRSSNKDLNGEPEAITDTDGKFRLEDLTPGKPVDLLAQRPGWSDTRVRRVTVPAETPVRVVMAPRVLVRGRVLDADAKPLPGADVGLEDGREGGPVIRREAYSSVRSGSAGEFEFADVSAGTYVLVASLAGFQNTEQEGLQVLPGKDLEGLEVVLRPASVVFGTVYGAQGVPLPETHVSVAGERGAVAPFDLTDGDGRYWLTSVAPGHQTIAARSHENRRTARELEVKAGENELDLQFKGGSDVSGSVLDEHNAPLAGARVQLSSTSSGGEFRFAGSDPDGRFTMSDVRDGEYRLVASLDGYASASLPAFTVAGVSVGGLELRLAKGARITGELRGLDLNQLTSLQVLANRVGGPPAMLLGAVDPTGHYLVDHVTSGEWSVAASIPGGRRTSGRVTVPDPLTDSVLDLDFGKGLVLSGHVLRGGAPLVDASAYLIGQSVTGRASTDTDADGRFRLEGIETGSYVLSVFGPGSAWSDSIQMDDNRDIEIAIGAGSVHGRAVDAEDASPLAGATLTLESAAPDVSRMNNLFGVSATTDSRGLFRMADVSAGAWTLRGELTGYAGGKTAVNVEDGQDADAELRMARTDGLVLEVSTPSGPASSVLAAVLNSSGEVVSAGNFQATDTGRVRLQGVPAGRYEVLLSANGTAVAALQATAPGSATIVRLQAGARLVAHVADLDPNTVPAKTTLTDPAGRSFRAPSSSDVRTWWYVSYGKSTIDGLPPGTWIVHVTAADGRVWSQTVSVRAGAETTVELH